MENAEIRSKLLAVAKELEKVEVKGKTNMTTILSCMTFLERMADDVIAPEVSKDGTET